MAYEIVRRLKEQNEKDILFKLSEAVNVSDKKIGELHQVFDRSFDLCRCLYADANVPLKSSSCIEPTDCIPI